MKKWGQNIGKTLEIIKNIKFFRTMSLYSKLEEPGTLHLITRPTMQSDYFYNQMALDQFSHLSQCDHVLSIMDLCISTIFVSHVKLWIAASCYAHHRKVLNPFQGPW